MLCSPAGHLDPLMQRAGPSRDPSQRMWRQCILW
jgi:hypothetical protein